MDPIAITRAEVTDIAHAIQLSVGPVFLLSGIGVFLNVLTSRLARVVDRARPMEERYKTAGIDEAADLRERLRVMSRRARHINRAITLSTTAALAVSLVVVLLFAATFVHFSLAVPVSLLFVGAMLLLVGALLSFLVEIRIAIDALRIGPG
ncbi:MAG: DUF2721 domain-containing protein [Steroidobacteraceae bacterium]|nr:DUF2721 domain-containing protein [Steroidobacteraceae bacterium]